MNIENSILDLFPVSDRCKQLLIQLRTFIREHRVYELEEAFLRQMAQPEMAGSPARWQPSPQMERLKEKARAAGLWNLFLPDSQYGAGLTNLEYAFLCEEMGKSLIAPEIFNCSAPDTGNMEVLVRYGTPEQQDRWLKPLLDGRIRSCFAMTEPQVASSDATNIQASIQRSDRDQCYIVNGRKWWTSGAGDPRCQLIILMGRQVAPANGSLAESTTTQTSSDSYRQQSMLLIPMDTPGVRVVRPLTVFGYDDAPHGHFEIVFDDVRVPLANMLLGEGRGFEIAQGRLGPGRIHHCMRAVGMAERSLDQLVERAARRTAFKKRLIDHGQVRVTIAQCRLDIDAARLTVLHAAHAMDRFGNKAARGLLAAAKVMAPKACLAVLDRAIQIHGAAGVSGDFRLAYCWAQARTLRLADGPDEVHMGTIAKLELKRILLSNTNKSKL